MLEALRFRLRPRDVDVYERSVADNEWASGEPIRCEASCSSRVERLLTMSV